MNSKIFNLVMENLGEALNLPKYDEIKDSLTEQTTFEEMGITPVKFEKFQEDIKNRLGIKSGIRWEGTIENIVNQLDIKYSNMFFGEIWKPDTDKYIYTGWGLIDIVNKLEPKAVLDVGCGYNQFKDRIHNLTGIDPYNNMSDYQVDILEYANVDEHFDAIIALGSINFNSKEDIRVRIANCVKLLAKGGKIYFRVNPGIQHKHGPWVEVFAWSFEVAHEFAKEFGLELETFKQDSNDRKFFVYRKPD
jgi:SAM-dependent methyltransferase